MYRKISMVVLIAIAFCSCSAFADDLNPAGFRGLPGSVFAEFDFNDGGVDPSPPTNFSWAEGPGGEPLHPSDPCILFNPEFFVWQNGTWVNTFLKPAFMRIKLPNIIDDFEVKIIHLQITWVYEGMSPPPTVVFVDGEDAEDGPLSDVVIKEGQTLNMGLMRHTSYNIRIEPNPDWETIDVLVRPDMGIKQVVVDTISIPGFVLGDANNDGEINLLDVAPFINLVANSVWTPTVDTNEDGNVNLLDVEPFIQILGGAG